MNKAILIIDMPENCMRCPCSGYINYNICEPIGKPLITNDIYERRPEWCPLREVPQKIGIEEALEMERVGHIGDVVNSYNACIDKILKENE